MDETAEVQALLMHGRIIKPADAKPASRLVGRYLEGLGTTDPRTEPVPSAHSEEAMRAQAAAERLLGGPANG